MMRRFLRALVLRTNAYPPFKQLNRAIYALALACFLRYVIRGRPAVRSVYVKRSQNARDWIPGLSDIDLRVILDARLPLESECRVLESFWTAHRRLKTFFPMIGEVGIFNQDELGAWLAGTGVSPGRHDWTLVYGEPDQNLEIEAAPGWRMRALSLAWWIYEDFLPPCLAQPDSFVRRQDVRRRVGKIMNSVAPILREAGRPEPSPPPGDDTAELVASALKALEDAAVHVFPIHPRHPARGETSQMICSRSGAGRMLVIDDGLPPEAIVQTLRTSQGAPLVLPRCLLEFRVRHYDPYDYSMLLHDWGSTGKHPLEDIAPPGEPEFITYSLSRVWHLQVFSRGEELFSQRLLAGEVEMALKSAMALMLVRDGRTAASRKEVSARWPREFPEYRKELDNILGLIGEERFQEARRACFLLFRSLANQFGPWADAVRQRQEPLSSAASVK